ncbi:NAD(P)H-dependent flavin oxidoreductase [Ensifer adhaerens]
MPSRCRDTRPAGIEVSSTRPPRTAKSALKTCSPGAWERSRYRSSPRGGIMTGSDIQAVLAKGASAVQMGTAFLKTAEAGTSAPYRAALEGTERKTRTTRAFSGRFARGVENRFMNEVDAAAVMPFPAQNKFTRDIRAASTAKGSPDFLSLWSGTGKGELWQGSASDLIARLFPA